MRKKKSFYNCLTTEDENQSHFQLSLFSDDKDSQNPTPPNRHNKTKEGLFKKCQKPQISSIPGLPITRPNRYRVKEGNQILGEYLILDEALVLAKRGKR